jgi:hypothetical protein
VTGDRMTAMASAARPSAVGREILEGRFIEITE